MLTILNIAGTDYTGPQWAAAGIRDLEFSWDLEAYWSFSFSVFKTCASYPPFVPGVAISVRTTADDGTNVNYRFVGDLQRPEGSPSDTGVTWHYTATDLKRRADYITLTGLDGSGTASFNLSPDDELSLYNTSGQTVGNILIAVLQQATNAANLNAVGVGAYTSLSPPTLPAITLADLAALTVVPPVPVQLRGESILNTLEQLILTWHPQYALWVLPDGTIRCRSIFALDPVAVALPAADGTGDDVDWPSIVGPDCTDCFTSWQIMGLDIQAAYLNEVDGTLTHAWTSYQQSSWTIADFLSPKNAADVGTASSVTSTSCTVHSDFAAAHWPVDFWNGNAVQGWIYLEYLAGAGIALYEMRQITSCTALSAGGSATVTWDPGLPLNATSYTRYRIVGLNAPQSLVGRAYYVTEPASGATGVNTYVGSHMYPRNPKGMPVGNNSRVFLAFYPYAFVQWSRTGAYPWFEVPVNVQLDPLTGRIILAEPAVLKSAGLAGTSNVLQSRYPTSFSEGLYKNLQVVIPYNRGTIAARAPASGDSGTAFTKFGIRRPKVHHVDTFTWIGDSPALANLAAEHLACVRDAVVSGSINYYELPANFDAFTPGFCLRASCSGATTPLDGLDLPVRSATIRWHDDDPVLYSASLRFNNKKRPFEGDALYIHPALGRNVWGSDLGDSVFGMPGGMMDMGSFNQHMLDVSARRRAELPTNALSHEPVGQHPAGQDVSQNPIGQSLAQSQADRDAGHPDADFGDGGVGGLAEGGRPGQPNRAARRAARQAYQGHEGSWGPGDGWDKVEGHEGGWATPETPTPPPPTPAPRRPGGLADRRGEPRPDDTTGG